MAERQQRRSEANTERRQSPASPRGPTKLRCGSHKHMHDTRATPRHHSVRFLHGALRRELISAFGPVGSDTAADANVDHPERGKETQ